MKDIFLSISYVGLYSFCIFICISSCVLGYITFHSAYSFAFCNFDTICKVFCTMCLLVCVLSHAFKDIGLLLKKQIVHIGFPIIIKFSLHDVNNCMKLRCCKKPITCKKKPITCWKESALV